MGRKRRRKREGDRGIVCAWGLYTHTHTQVEIGDGAASRLVFSVYGPTWRPHMPIVPIVFEMRLLVRHHLRHHRDDRRIPRKLNNLNIQISC